MESNLGGTKLKILVFVKKNTEYRGSNYPIALDFSIAGTFKLSSSEKGNAIRLIKEFRDTIQLLEAEKKLAYNYCSSIANDTDFVVTFDQIENIKPLLNLFEGKSLYEYSILRRDIEYWEAVKLMGKVKINLDEIKTKISNLLNL